METGAAEVTDQVLDDVFSAAFDEEIGKIGDEPKTEEPKVEEPKVEEPKVEEPKVEEPKVEEPKVEVPAENPEIASMREQIAKLQAQLAEKPKEEPKVVEPTEAEKAALQEEQAAWEKFKADWPDQAAIIEKKEAATRAEFAKLETQLKEMKEMLTPVVSTVTETENDKFLAPILKEHPDVFEIHEKLAGWVEKLPARQKAGCLWALNEGTSQDVIEVINDYKKANGIGKAESKSEPTEEEKAAAAAKEAKLKKMETTSDVRTSVTAEPDPEDFDSAFEQEMKKYSKAG